MLQLAGPVALSAFRIAKLIERLRARDPAVEGVEACYVHFVDLTRTLGAPERGVLEELLTYGPRQPAAAGGAGGAVECVLVVPRLGTISPWSSKASEIAQACGLGAVRRIERGIAYRLHARQALGPARLLQLAALLHDRMTEVVLLDDAAAARLFEHHAPRPFTCVSLAAGRSALEAADRELGLALSVEEMDYLLASFARLGRDPSDVELMMFAQANSEHCRHKIFNARWIIDGEAQPESLFEMIRYTHERHPAGVLSAYRDNAAVLAGADGARWFPAPDSGVYRASHEPIDILIKVETHNHPTAISPFPGAATGSGGEIRDEGATGRGGKPKAGLTGFCVSHLRIPGYEQPWERAFGAPARIASALDIMIEGPIGAASFNNEFGRPAVCGYFRTFEQHAPGDPAQRRRGYHKPIMLAGGVGNVRRMHVDKAPIPVGAPLVVLGGPAMLIGLGGGAASSLGSGSSSADLDFASVQRGNPEMQRRAQEVIDRCWALGADNPIALIHDVGAGGLCNAVPEAVAHDGRGAHLDLRAIPSAEPGLSPLELWCNEAQERYVLVIAPAALSQFAAIAARERCPYAVIGTIDASGRLKVCDPLFGSDPVDMPLEVLLGKPPRLTRTVASAAGAPAAIRHRRADPARGRVPRAAPAGSGRQDLSHHHRRSHRRRSHQPRSAGGPVAGAGERRGGDARRLPGMRGRSARHRRAQPGGAARCARLRAPRGGGGDHQRAGGRHRGAVADPPVGQLDGGVRRARRRRGAVRDGARGGEGAVPAAGHRHSGRQGLAVDADRLARGGRRREVRHRAGLAGGLGVRAGHGRRPHAHSGAAAATRARPRCGWSTWRGGNNRLGGSALAQVYRRAGRRARRSRRARPPAAARRGARGAARRGLLRAYHDRSDGGLFVTLVEMAFAGHCGLEVALPAARAALAQLFAEEPGVVMQVLAATSRAFTRVLARHGLLEHALLSACRSASCACGSAWRRLQLDESWADLRRAWSETSWRLRRLRDDPQCADEEFAAHTRRARPAG